MTIRPLVDLLAVKKKQETKRSINEEIHTQVTGRTQPSHTPLSTTLALFSFCFHHLHLCNHVRFMERELSLYWCPG